MRRLQLILMLGLVSLATAIGVRAQVFTPADVVRPDTLLSGEWRGTVVTANGMRYAVLLLVEAFSDGLCDVKYEVAGVTAGPRRMRTASCQHSSLLFVDDSTNGAFTGKLLSAEGVIDGVWESGRTRSELRLYAVSRPRLRIQDEAGPQPYVERNLTLTFSGGQRVGATLCLPDTAGTWPLMVLVSDRGIQDRDSRDPSGHRPFRVIADYAAERQWAVLRFDDPASGCTAADLVALLDRVARLPYVDGTQVILVGHGEGGLSAVKAAAQRPAIVQGVICAATPAVDGRVWITEQIRVADALVGIDPDVSRAAADLVGVWYDIAASSKTVDEQIAAIGRATDSLLEVRQDLLSAYSLATELQSAQRDRLIENRLLPWLYSYRDIQADSIGGIINDADLPVLALLAEQDAVVPSEIHAAAWRVIQQSEPSTTVEVIQSVNHGFQPCVKCTGEEAAHSSTTIAEEVLDRIVSWGNQRVGR